MPLYSLLYTDGGADSRGEWRLIVGNKQPLKDVQILFYRFCIDIFVVRFLDVVLQGFVGCRGAFVPCKGAQQQAHFCGITPDTIYTVNIIINYGIQVFRRKQRSLLRRNADAAGPAAPDD